VRASAIGLGALVLACMPSANAAPPPAPSLVLTVDATDAALGRTHNHLVIAARPGPLTLAYPKWVPGEHGPTGPLSSVLDLTISANGQVLTWKRDPGEMYELAITVPAGASRIEVDFDTLHTGTGLYGGNAVANATMIDVMWNQVVLYPKGARASALTVEPNVKLPKGWRYATPLTGATEHDGVVSFAKVSLEMLVDSPLIAGAHMKTFDLGSQGGAAHSLAAFAENEASLAAAPARVEAWKRLVVEANALFGAHHYDRYQFLLVLSDNVPWFGLEHHQTSENYSKEQTLIDPDIDKAIPDLLPHEYVHSWNGKYRRPRGLATPDFQQPMRGDLLWVYEGLTNYLGFVLAARSGLATLEDLKQQLVRDVTLVSGSGRSWRPLADTAIAAQVLGDAPGIGESARRALDYYPEGTLIWLEADVVIRQRTQGARSLDDFCQRFHGGKSGPVEVRPYDLEEVLKTLNEVAPNDWRAFFEERIFKVAPKVPMGGIEGAGYRMGVAEKRSELQSTLEKVFKFTSYIDSLGFALGEDNLIGDVRQGSPAAQAGMVARMKVLAVNGRKATADQFTSALAAGKTGTPIELITERDGYYRTSKITYRGGEIFRVLERDPSKPDLLEAILKPKASTLPPPEPGPPAKLHRETIDETYANTNTNAALELTSERSSRHR